MQSDSCNVDVNGNRVSTKIMHKGRGKFVITEGDNIGKIVDASDVLDCKDSL